MAVGHSNFSYYETETILEPESNFEVLPPEINLEIIHGQQPGSPPPELGTVDDEIDIQQFDSDLSPHPAPLFHEVQDEIDCAPAHSNIEKAQNKKPNKSKKRKTKIKPSNPLFRKSRIS